MSVSLFFLSRHDLAFHCLLSFEARPRISLHGLVLSITFRQQPAHSRHELDLGMDMQCAKVSGWHLQGASVAQSFLQIGLDLCFGKSWGHGHIERAVQNQEVSLARN